MNDTVSIRQCKIAVVAALLFLTGIFFRVASCPAAEPEASAGARQIEATVVHIDQYAVYAPGLVFYFDTRMDKRKVASLMKTAEQFRNKKAIITYSSTSELGRDKHVLLVDIASPGTQMSAEQHAPENPVQPAEVKTRLLKSQPQPPAVPVDRETAEPLAPKPPSAVQPREPRETAPVPTQPATQSAAITREELTAFVRNILALNEKKDLNASAYYAERVNYYDRGVVDRAYVRRDLGYYFNNWNTIATSLDGDVVMIVIDQPDLRIAKFVTSFAVRNSKKALAGKTENIWKVQRINGHLQLVDVKQKVIAVGNAGQ